MKFHTLYTHLTESTKLKLDIPKDILNIHKAFKKNGKKLYIVGGAIRDAILGKKPKDWDLATDATPDEMIKIAKDNGMKVVELGKEFGVIIVNGDEIATFRKDIGKGRRPDSVEFTDIKTDVQRRDLTINALFYDIDKQEIVDLIGGIKDLHDKKIRTVGIAKDRFDEDPLRKLRALRFAGKLGGDMHQDIIDALTVDPSMKGVSTERIRDEFIKGLQKSKSPKAYLNMADDMKMLDLILPNLNLNKKFIDHKDYIVQLANLLKGNSPDEIRKKLNKLSYSSLEVNQIALLLELSRFNPNNIVKYRKMLDKAKLSNEQLSAFGKLINKEKALHNLAKFKLSVKGSDVPQDIKGKAIGDYITKMEIDKFNSL